MKKESEIVHFECINPKCNYIVEVKKDLLEDAEFKKKSSEVTLIEVTCPKCSGFGFKQVSEEKELEIEKKIKEAELEIKKEKIKEAELEKKKKEAKKHEEYIEKADEVVEYIIKEEKKVFEDLSKKLMNKEITPQRFIALFYNISCKIIASRKKEYLPDWFSERKKILDMGQNVLDLYNLEEDQEEIIEGYNVQEDKIYTAYSEIYKDRDVVSDFYYKDEDVQKEILEAKRLKDQEAINKLQSETKLLEYMRNLEKKAQEREEKTVTRITDRTNQKLGESFSESLKKDVKKL
jgi:predicted  nucleic acid-binding Zn-ribbon protein